MIRTEPALLEWRRRIVLMRRGEMLSFHPDGTPAIRGPCP